MKKINKFINYLVILTFVLGFGYASNVEAAKGGKGKPTPTVVVSPTETPTPSPTQQPSPTVTPTLEPMSISITSPNGGEVYQRGETVNITWSAPERIDSVMLAYKTCESCQNWIATGVENTDSYEWTIPSTQQLGSNYKIYVIGYDTGAGSVTDISDSSFEIVESSTLTPTPSQEDLYVKVLSPNGGEVFDAGSTQTITWEASETIDKVSIGYKRCDSCMEWIATGVENTGSYDWTIPEDMNASYQYKVYIIGYDTGVGSANDVSDSDFTINAPEPQIESIWVPSGAVGTTMIIYGRGFGTEVGSVVFKNGSTVFEAPVAANDWRDYRVFSSVPGMISTPFTEFDVYVVTKDGVEIGPHKYEVTYAQPQIYSIEPQGQRPGKMVTITGKNFTDEYPGRVSMYCDGVWHYAEDTNRDWSWSENTVTFQIPRSVPRGSECGIDLKTGATSIGVYKYYTVGN